ncbi:MAG: glycosyltransferase family 4 protein [Chloroflexota bacterium]
MRIIYVLDQPELGGGVKVVFQHAQLLLEQGYAVTVMAGAPKPDWTTFRGEYLNYMAGAPRLESGDVIIATYYTTIPFIQSFGLQPTIHFCQGYEGDLPHLAPQLAQIEALYRLPIPTFVVTPSLGAVVRERFGRASFVVSPPLDPIFRPLLFRRSPQRIPQVVIPGIFESQVKGVPTALQAVRRLREMGLNCRVVRISTFPLSEEEKAILTPERYLFQVSPREVAQTLRHSDLLLFPSLPAEGFGLPVVEAMASKIPVVASRIPSVEYIGNPVLAPIGDSEAFAQEAYRLLTDVNYWRETRRVGYAAAQKFRPEAIKRQLMQGLEWASGRAS